MWREIVLLLTFFVTFQNFVVGTSKEINDEVGNPLFLTPYLEKGDIQAAKELSKVKPDIGTTDYSVMFRIFRSYSGYFTVDKERESHLFFWFFPAQEDVKNAPVTLWVQGGPGMSSLTSVFEEIGPFTYTDDDGIFRRRYSWNMKQNLLFIDQPVGTGFSFTGKGSYAVNRQTYTEDLYAALVQFFQMFPDLKDKHFYIAGHSYAGHFIPALGHMIHSKNPSAKVKIHLKKMMIGNGWMDVFYQSDYGSHLYNLGLIDLKQKEVFDGFKTNITSYIKSQNWQKALEVLIKNILTEAFNDFVGNVSKYNYLEPISNLFEPYQNFIQQQSTRKAIHVGNAKFSFINEEVRNSMALDFVYSVKPLVEELLEHYPIVFYTGQLDIITGYPMVSNFLSSLDWSGKEEFKNASRMKWCVEGELAGYFKSGHNLHDVLVRNAGHFVPRYQPFWAYTLANSVNTGFSSNPFHELKSC